MEVPLTPYWQGSRYGPTMGMSQSAKNDSNTLEKNAVLEMFLKSSSEVGFGIFGIGTWYSLTHCLGYSSVLRMELKIVVTGVVSSQDNS